MDWDDTGGGEGLADVGPEAPDADAAEQHTPAAEESYSWTPRGRFGVDSGIGTDVNEADAADQERAVELDEDDYR